jgi:hypothetical protein
MTSPTIPVPSSPPEHEECAELVPAYALECLSAEDARRVRAHLAECPECQTVLRECQSVAEGLLYAEPADAVPPHLEEQLCARLHKCAPKTPPER